ncbi:hypothetical protein GCM10009601_51280 [Streptomyces thermospinosisporus]|uniref:Replication protein n=1 Tax=Streptomyces thermospinosisporus TaxID=161482 RepID=A0ABN1Z7X1_9ACTN
MARIRSIKPEFFTSLAIADQPLSARLTFIGLWTYVDDNGVGLADPRLIRAAIWPLEEAPDILQRTREDLQSLHAGGLITLYEASGKQLVAVTNWAEHQKVSHPRKPRYPRPEEVDHTPADLDSCNPPKTSGNPPEDLQSPRETLRPEQGSGSREQGAGKEEDAEPPASAENPIRHDVERVCKHLADVVAQGGGKKPTITKTWRRDTRLLIDRDGVTPDQAIAAIDWAHNDPFWQAHILSPGKLRAKYETLRRQALARQRGQRPAGPPTAPSDIPKEEIPDVLQFG